MQGKDKRMKNEGSGKVCKRGVDYGREIRGSGNESKRFINGNIERKKKKLYL